MTLAAIELTSPLALWGLLAAAPILAFHLYFRRRRRMLVPFAPLLVESAGQVRAAARFKRLREWVSMLLRLLALACAVLALGGLRPAEAKAPPYDLFLVVDADITTAAREDDGALRLAHATALARDFVRAMPASAEDATALEGRVSVIVAGRAPRLWLAPTTRRSRALERLEEPLRPEPARADLPAAVDTALQAAGRRPAARVVVLTARAVTSRALPPAVSLAVVGTGRTRDDQGLVDFHVERSADGAHYAVRASLRNDAGAVRARTVSVTVDGRNAGSERVELPASSVLDVRFEVPTPPEAAWLELALDGTDAFPANDSLSARLAPLAKPSVLVVHGGRVRPYTAAVIEALAAEGLIDAKRGGYVHVRDVERAGIHDVVVVDGVALPAAALVPGGYVFLAPLTGALPFELGPVVTKPLIWRTVPGHPLVGDLDFRKAFVARGQTLRGEGLTPLAFAEGAPVLGEGERGGVRYVALGLHPEGSALPTQLALPRLVRSSILRLARAPRATLEPFYRQGEVVRPRTTLPGGPHAELAWAGPARDDVLAAASRGAATGRIDPEGAGWRVPAGAVGRVRIATGMDGPSPWTGLTAFAAFDTEQTIVPAQDVGAAPAPAAPRASQALRWRRGLLALAVLLLLLDLVLVASARRRRGAPQTGRS